MEWDSLLTKKETHFILHIKINSYFYDVKFKALLLSAFILFLSAKPITEFASFHEVADQCCKEKSQQPIQQNPADPQETKDTECNGLCSPFQPCCPFVNYYTVGVALTLPKVFTALEKCSAKYHVSFSSSYATDFWQPPKIA